MQPSLDWEHSISGGRAMRLAGEWLCRPASGTALAYFALAMLIFLRRTAGAIHEPLPISGILAAGFVLCLLAGAAHWAESLRPAKWPIAFFPKIALSLSLFAVAATLSVPGTSTAGLCLFWTMLLLEEGWSWNTRFFHTAKNVSELIRSRKGEAPAEPKDALPSPIVNSARQEPRPPENTKPSLETAETIPPEEVTQQLTRSTATNGVEEFAGWLRVPFAPGERTHSVHLAFCPPFKHTPELHVEQLDGPEARIKTAQVLPYGARLDLKLSSAGESPAGVVLHFFARERE